MQKQENELQEKLEKGEITQAEYETLTIKSEPAEVPPTGFIVPQPPDNSALLEQLTEEDYQYLNLK